MTEVDSKVNALPTLCFDRARTRAKVLMEMPIGERGLLAGLSRQLLRRRRHAAQHRPRRAYACLQDRSQSDRAWPDGAQRRGPCADARCHERRTSGRSAVAALFANLVSNSRALGRETEA